MRVIGIFMAMLMALTLSSCSLEEIQAKADSKLDQYSRLTPEEVALQLVTDGYYAGSIGRSIAWCQAKAIVASKLPEAIYEALLDSAGATIAQRAEKLRRPGLGDKLRACVRQYA